MCNIKNCLGFTKIPAHRDKYDRNSKANEQTSTCNLSNRKNNHDQSSTITSQIPSSPSMMKTNELTDIYLVPSNYYSTPNDVVTANGFTIEKEIGKGSYAIVYSATRMSDNLSMACKVMRLANTAKNAKLSVKNELFILERINHPHIVKVYTHFIVDVDNIRYVYIFMQLADGDSLSVHMRKVKFGLPEAVCKRMFSQMVSAVDHMHQNGIAHRDIKMGNILLDNNLNVLVTDFGLSRVAYRQSKGGTVMSNKFCGTMPYMAPEILLTKEYSVEYNPFVADIWALGVVLFCIVNRGYPFVEGEKMIDQQMSHKVRFSKKVSFTPNEQLIDLFYKLLTPNVDQRIKMNELMVHPWIEAEIIEIDQEIAKKKTLATK